jgi:hypothetical protein
MGDVSGAVKHYNESIESLSKLSTDDAEVSFFLFHGHPLRCPIYIFMCALGQICVVDGQKNHKNHA